MKKLKIRINIEEHFTLNDHEAYSLPLEEVTGKLETNIETGLSQQNAQERLNIVGPNVLPKVKTSLLKVYLEPLSNWLVVSYIVASAVLGFISFLYLPQLWFHVSVWIPLVAINIMIILIQTVRAQNELTAIQQLSAPKILALRDNKLIELSSEDLVPGDIVELKQGNMVPADCRVIDSTNLKVNESSLTGESEGVEKHKENISDLKEDDIFLKKSTLFLGTFVTVGTAIALVVKTGRNTQIGQMAGKLRELNVPKISLRRRINKLVKNLAIIIVLYLSIAIAYNSIIFYLNGDLFSSLYVMEIAKSLIKAISMMPLNIPLLATIIMLSGAIAMNRHNVIIRNLNAIENLGRVSVVFADKTGTITQNKMTVKWIYNAIKEGRDRLYYITEKNSAFKGEIFPIARRYECLEKVIDNPTIYQNKKPINIAREVTLEYLIASAYLNNDNTVIINEIEKQTTSSPSSDATDVALVNLFEKLPLDLTTYSSRFDTIQNWPLDNKTKLITKILKDNESDNYFLVTKGATETLLEKSSYGLNEKGQIRLLNQNDKIEILKKIEIFSQYGNRVISFAYKDMRNLNPELKREFMENSLVYLGFVAMTDPSRKGVSSAISKLKSADIKPVMITGDSPVLAQSIAEEIGMIDNDQQKVTEGSQITEIPYQDFKNTSAFARVSPDDKGRIVARYKEANHVVAMTGDGVNDAQAIMTADVGIAMGLSGTEMAKQTADVVLADDSLTSIAVGIREGRGVFEKIQNIVFFYIAVSVAEAIVLFGSSFAQEFFLLNSWQLIYIAALQFISPFALVIDKLSKDIMKEKPKTNEGLIGRKRRTAFIAFTLALILSLSIAYVLAFNGSLPVSNANKAGYNPNLSLSDPLNPISWEQAKARTMLLSVVVIATSTLVLSIRRINKPIYKSIIEDKNKKIWPFILSVPLIHLLLMYLPGMQNILLWLTINLDIIYLTLNDWVIVFLLGLMPIAVLEFAKFIRNRNN